MKPINNKILVTLVDNTVINNSGFDLSFVKGYTALERQTILNQGINEHAQNIWFFSYDIIQMHKNTALLDMNNVFLIEDELVKDGIIVKSTPFKQIKCGFGTRTQNFYKVIKSSCKDILVNSIIIIQPHCFYRFNKDNEQYAFIRPNNVMLMVNKKILPGPSFSLVKEIHSEGIFKIPFKNKGIDYLTNKMVYFTNHFFKITLNKDTYYIVNNSKIYANA